MTSILNISETDQSHTGLSAEPVTSPQSSGSDWDKLRSITQNAYHQKRSPNLRMPLLVLLLIVALGSLGLVLHNHMPALVSFGEELSQTVHRFASGSPTPSAATQSPARTDLRPRPARRRSAAGVSPSQPEQAFDPASHPFYATAVIGGRRISLTSSDGIVVLDVAAGTWNFASQAE